MILKGFFVDQLSKSKYSVLVIRIYFVVPQKPQGPKSASQRINPEKIMGGGRFLHRPLFFPAPINLVVQFLLAAIAC